MTSIQKSSDSEVEHLLQASDSKDDYGSDSANDSPARRFKIAQKQKRLSFDTEASSPKLQKLSLKRLYHNLSSPPMEKRKEKREKSIETSTKSTLVQKELRFENNPDSAQDQSVPEGGPMLQDSLDSVPSTDKSSHLTKLPETENRRIHDTDTVTVEVHKLLNDVQFLDTSKNQDDSCEMLVSSTIDDSDNLIDFSMEATLSESVNLSQLCSFDSLGQAACLPDGSEKQSGLGFVPVENSLATPDSPTGDNVSEIPSSEDSDIIESTDMKLTSTDDNFVQEVQNKQYSGNVKSIFDKSKQNDLTQLDTQKQMALENNTDLIRNSAKVSEDVPSSINFNSNSAQEHLPLNENIVDDIILSPPESFHDDGKKRNNFKTDDLGATIAHEIKASSKSPGARTMERSKTEVHEICSKLVSGIAVSGSFGQELFRANSDFVDSHVFNKKRSCSDKLSPISPNEDSKRKFESEIGRLIVRDRQMKLEMEQMKAERQKCKGSEMPTLPEVEKTKTKTEKKFADALDLRKSPSKTFDDRKKVDTDDFFKSQKENIEDKKFTDNVSSQNYSRYLRMENKPSVKELLSKFEGRTQFSDTIQKFNSDAIHNSPLKHSSNVFSNVQVINHNFSLTPSKSSSSHSEDRIQSSQDNQHPLSKEHIFQTECVIRFPHPKTSILSQIQNESHRNGLSNFEHKYDPSESNSWSSGQYDHHTKVNHSRTAFLSSDNLSTSPGRCRNDFSIPQHQGNSTSEHSRMSRSVECKRTPVSFDKDRKISGNDNNLVQENKDEESNTFSSFKDTFTRANRLTAQMRNEFLQRGLPQDNGNYTYYYGQDNFSGNNGSYFSGSPPVSRRRQPPTRQRPKSVPPPICRLSLANTKQSPTVHQGSHTQFIPTLTEFSQNVPKTSGVKLTNGKESTDASQTYGPPKRVRDRAAIFERSLSFSGPGDAKTLPSSAHSTQKAQQDSSAR